MKRQIVAIHGGSTFEEYEDYIKDLKNKSVDVDRFKFEPDWKKNLQNDLGNDYKVLNPRMPNKDNAQYKEWKIWLYKIVSVLDDEVILIGHSLGGLFLAKYLSENEFPKSIISTILVAAPYDDEGFEKTLASFSLPDSLSLFDEQGGEIYLISSKDDPVVPFDHVDKYNSNLSSAEKVIFEDREHFNQDNFPEIIEIIKEL